MTPERRATLITWARRAVMVVAFGGMAFAIDHLVRSYSFDDVASALGDMEAWTVALAIGVLFVQYTCLVVREYLALHYARTGLVWSHAAIGGIVARSLSTLGVASITGIGLRLRIYGGWGVGTTGVARMTVFNEITWVAGLAAQVAVAFACLPLPANLEQWIPNYAVRGVGIVAGVLVVAYVGWCSSGPRERKILSFTFATPNRSQMISTIALPVADLLLGATITYLCLPTTSLSLWELAVIGVIASVAGSLTQIPGGLGVYEGIVLLFVDDPVLGPAVIGALLIRRVLTNVLPILVGAALLVIIEVRRKPAATVPEGRGEVIATVLAALTFVLGVIVMVTATSPLANELGHIGQALALAAGTAVLFVSRGLQRRSRYAWWIMLALVLGRGVVGVLVPPPLLILALMTLAVVLLVMSRSVFTVSSMRANESLGWWAAFAVAIVGTMWSSYQFAHRHVTVEVLIAGGTMLGVAAIVIAAVAVRIVHARTRSG